MSSGHAPGPDQWATISFKLRPGDVARLDTACGTTSRSEWLRTLVLGALSKADAGSPPVQPPGERHPGPGPQLTRHGTKLGREHGSLQQHLVEDHGVSAHRAATLTDAATHGLHDGLHNHIWAFAYDLPHPTESETGL